MDIKSLIKVLAAVLVFLFALGWGAYQFISALLDKLSSIQSDLAKAIVAASATVLIAVVTLVAGKLWEQRLKIRDEIRAKKVPIYEGHIRTFFNIFFGSQTGKCIPETEQVAAFAAFSEQMITWGSSDVIKAWIEFRSLNPATTSSTHQIDKLEALFLAIRKDVGNDVRKLRKGDLLRMFVNDDPPATSAGKPENQVW